MEKHLLDRALQCIISGELKERRLLHYDELSRRRKVCMQRLKYEAFFFFFFLLSNPLICKFFTFFFLICLGFCFLQDYDYGQIYVVLASFHNTLAKASGHIHPTPIGFTTDDVPISQQVALAFDHVCCNQFFP
jgi:hypothetical protein